MALEREILQQLKKHKQLINELEVQEYNTVCYGSIWGNEIAWAQASAVQNTWYPVADTDMTDGLLNGITHDGSGKLTIIAAGIYLCNYQISAEISVANKHIQATFGITPSGGVLAAQNDGTNHIEHVSANAQIPMGGVAIFNIGASSTLEVLIRTTDTGTPTLTVDHCNLAVVRIA